MLDLDYVITDGSWKNQIEDFLGEKIDLEKTGYYLEEALGDRKQEFYDSLDDINMYKNAELKKDAFDMIKRLNEKFELYIVSSYALKDVPHRVGEHLKNKYEFIYYKLPFINQSQIMFVNNKTKFHFDYGIDDKTSNLRGCDTKLLFLAWHNKNKSEEEYKKEGFIVVKDWKDIADILLKGE